MAIDRYAKLEMQIRNASRAFWLGKLASGRSKAVCIPGFEIPRSEKVDLFIGPKGGTVICLVQRSDFVTVYRHTVGQLVGSLAHYHRMTDRQIREALRGSKGHPDLVDLKQPRIDAVKLSKQLISDRKTGKITVALVTDLPEVPQQAVELDASFMQIAGLLKVWMCASVRRKKLCQAVEYYAVTIGGDETQVAVHPLDKAIKPLIKEAQSH